jgi:hypothetical protein
MASDGVEPEYGREATCIKPFGRGFAGDSRYDRIGHNSVIAGEDCLPNPGVALD